MTKRQEISIVKSALRRADIPFRRVCHGTGTATWWLKIYLNNGEDEDRKVIKLAQKVTGRFGPYDGNISVMG